MILFDQGDQNALKIRKGAGEGRGRDSFIRPCVCG